MKNEPNLQEDVLKANLDLVKLDLVKLTWGNASAINRESNSFFIKPSGVAYDGMTADQMVEVSMQNGSSQHALKPSSDSATHLALYKAFQEIGGIVHTHSEWATSWAQACREIPCYGTTHADHFFGTIPLTRRLLPEEIDKDYELNTGKVIIERFASLNAMDMPGVLVAEHGPFVWGKTVAQAVEHALILEEIAKMAFRSVVLGKNSPVQDYLLKKHYYRKHGSSAYYGQKK